MCWVVWECSSRFSRRVLPCGTAEARATLASGWLTDGVVGIERVYGTVELARDHDGEINVTRLGSDNNTRCSEHRERHREDHRHHPTSHQLNSGRGDGQCVETRGERKKRERKRKKYI